MNNKKVIAILAITLFGGADSVLAATATTTFQVDATVIGSCNVSATNLAFGNYDTLSATPTDATSSVTVQCSLSTAYDIGLDEGTGTGATVAVRKLTKGADTLNYSLFQESARTNVWGNTVSTDTVSGTGTGVDIVHTVYGRVPAGQVVNTGAYADTVTVTVTF